MKKTTIALVFTLSLVLIPLVSAGKFLDSTDYDFNSGRHENTMWDDNYTRLVGGNTSGMFVSRVFEAPYKSIWQIIEWDEVMFYSDELPDEGKTEGGINMTKNRVLYHFDEETGTAAADSSKNNFKGEIKGSVELGQPGKFDYSFVFEEDGNDHVSMPSTILDDLTDFTFEVWFKTVKTGNQAIISGANNETKNEFLIFLNSDTEVNLYFKNITYAHAIPSISDGNWHHIVWTRSGAIQYIYLDGAQIGSNNVGTIAVDIDVGGLVLAEEQDCIGGCFASDQSFDGYMDEVAIYNRALNSSQVLDHYKRGALDLKFQVRSDDDNSDWGDFIGPDVTRNTYFTANFNSELPISNSKYFQYKAYFSTEKSGYSPKLIKVTVHYEMYNQPPSKPILTSPENNAGFNDVGFITLEYTSTDPEGSEIYYYVYISTKTGFKANSSTLIYSGTNSQIKPRISEYGRYFWKVIANDGQLNSSASKESTFKIQKDIREPVIRNEQITQNIAKGFLVNVTANITDISNITAWLSVRDHDNNITKYFMSKIRGFWKITFIPIIIGNYSFKISASDAHGNINNDRNWINFSVNESEVCNVNNICETNETYQNCAYDCCDKDEAKHCGSGIGACKQGTRTCGSDGNWEKCTGEIKPVREICANNLDDDCDGITDTDCVSDVVCSDGKVPYTGCLCNNVTYISGYCYNDNYSETSAFEMPIESWTAIIIGIILVIIAMLWHFKGNIFKKKTKTKKPREKPKKSEAPKDIPKEPPKSEDGDELIISG